jgi:hypothetical protein
MLSVVVKHQLTSKPFHSVPNVFITESGSKRLPLCNAVVAILLFTWSRGKPLIQNTEMTNHEITLQSFTLQSPQRSVADTAFFGVDER